MYLLCCAPQLVEDVTLTQQGQVAVDHELQDTAQHNVRRVPTPTAGVTQLEHHHRGPVRTPFFYCLIWSQLGRGSFCGMHLEDLQLQEGMAWPGH